MTRDTDLDWLLCVWPGLASPGSGHAALVAALERGQALGGGAASSDGAEQALERARPHVPRARRLESVWVTLDPAARRVLAAYYRAPECRAPGVSTHLRELAGVCLVLTTGRAALEHACTNAAMPLHAARIRAELRRAQAAVAAAHRAWRTARKRCMLSWAGG